MRNPSTIADPKLPAYDAHRAEGRIVRWRVALLAAVVRVLVTDSKIAGRESSLECVGCVWHMPAFLGLGARVTDLNVAGAREEWVLLYPPMVSYVPLNSFTCHRGLFRFSRGESASIRLAISTSTESKKRLGRR